MTNPIQTSRSSELLEPIARRKGHGRATLKDVATQAGVTTMTVSRFLRAPEVVAPLTAHKITAALQQTGYSPNRQAGSLASGRSNAVAVIVPNLTHSIFADALHGLGLALQAAGLQMLVSSTGYSLAQEEQQVRTVLGWAPAAVVVTGRTHHPETHKLLLDAQQRDTPVVEIWDLSPAGEARSFQQFGFEHAKVGAAQARALIERGCTELAFIDVGFEEDVRAHERAQGFLDEAHAQGIRVEWQVAAPGDAVAQGSACFTALHAKCLNSTRLGIGLANDLLGIGALLQAQKAGYRIPGQWLFLGFGDFPAARYFPGGLSTMHIDGESMGSAVGQYIAKRLNPNHSQLTAAADQHTIVPKLIWRDV